MHFIEEVFGIGCNLYTDVLNCTVAASSNSNSNTKYDTITKAELRKGYYRSALKYHPDKNAATDDTATKKFQAITCAYQLLQKDDFRTEYNQTGKLPSTNDDDYYDDEFGDANKSGVNMWKDYFTNIFGTINTTKITDFAAKYKCSEEECRDVLQEFRKQKGDLQRMLEYVILSEPPDAVRWVEDYIRPAMDAEEKEESSTKNKNNLRQYKKTMEQTLQKLQKQIQNSTKKRQKNDDDDNQNSKKRRTLSVSDDDDDDESDESFEDDEQHHLESSDDEDALDKDDDDETESEESCNHKNASKNIRRNQKSNATRNNSKKPTPMKGKVTQAKTKKPHQKSGSKDNTMTDLISQIQQRHAGGGNNNSFRNFAERYGVALNDDNNDDPLDTTRNFDHDPIENDMEFAKIQAKLLKNKNTANLKNKKNNKTRK